MTAQIFSLPCYRMATRKMGMSHPDAKRLARHVAEEMVMDGDLVADPHAPTQASEKPLRVVTR